jgi:hypothetical protein
MLETKGQAAVPPSKSFFNLGNPLGGGSGGPACVAQTDFDQTKAKIHDEFTDVKARWLCVGRHQRKWRLSHRS